MPASVGDFPCDHTNIFDGYVSRFGNFRAQICEKVIIEMQDGLKKVDPKKVALIIERHNICRNAETVEDLLVKYKI